MDKKRYLITYYSYSEPILIEEIDAETKEEVKAYAHNQIKYANALKHVNLYLVEITDEEGSTWYLH